MGLAVRFLVLVGILLLALPVRGGVARDWTMSQLRATTPTQLPASSEQALPHAGTPATVVDDQEMRRIVGGGDRFDHHGG